MSITIIDCVSMVAYTGYLCSMVSQLVHVITLSITCMIYNIEVYFGTGCAHLRPGAVRRMRPGAVRRMRPGADRRMSPGRSSTDEPWAQFD